MAALQTIRDHDGTITGLVITDLSPDELSDLTRNPTTRPRTTTPAKARLGSIQRYPVRASR